MLPSSRLLRFGNIQWKSSRSHLAFTQTIYNNSTTPNVERKKIMIVGANGNLGAKLMQHWMNTHELFLVDKDPATKSVNKCLATSELSHHHIRIDLLKDCNDCSKSTLSKLVSQTDVIVHFAANNPFPDATWQESMDTVDMINNVLLSCTNQENLKNNKKTRIIFASSNHVMGGYRKQGGTLSTTIENGYESTAVLEPEHTVNPATKIELKNGYKMDATPYAMPKVFGERLSLSLCNLYPNNIEGVVIRIGWNQPGENLPSTLSAVGSHSDSIEDEREKTDQRKDIKDVNEEKYDDIDDCEDWFRHMWLSNVDIVQLFDCAVNYKFDEKVAPKWTVCNGVSNNSNSRWSVRNEIGYKPKLNVNDYDKQNKNLSTKQPIENVDFD